MLKHIDHKWLGNTQLAIPLVETIGNTFRPLSSNGFPFKVETSLFFALLVYV